MSGRPDRFTARDVNAMKTNMDQQLAWFMSSRGKDESASTSANVTAAPPQLNILRKSARSSFLVPSSPVLSQDGGGTPKTPKTRSGSRKKKSSTRVPMGLDDEHESPLKKAQVPVENAVKPLLIDLTSTPIAAAADEMPVIHSNSPIVAGQHQAKGKENTTIQDSSKETPWNGSELFDLNDSLLEQCFDTVRHSQALESYA